MSSPENWYAIHTRSKQERVVATRLTGSGISSYLPVVREVRRWSDRKKIIELPLFTCYLFVRLELTSPRRYDLLATAGILRLIGANGAGEAIPDDQIEAIRIMLENDINPKPCPFLKVGQRVRVRDGALAGVEGILSTRNGEDELVISIDAMERSLAIKVHGYEVVPA